MFPNVVDVVFNNDPVHAKNILFLSDGFTAAEEGLFDDVVREISRRFFKIAPFWLGTMRYRFNIFKCFTKSVSSGIDINGYIDNNNNIQNAIDANTKGRLYHQYHSFFHLENNHPREIFYSAGHDGDIQAAVNTVQYTQPLKDPSNVLSVCWKPPDQATPYQGRDFGLVVVLVNEDFYGGCAVTVPSPLGKFALVSIGGVGDYTILQPDLVISTSTPKEYDHTPISPTRRHYDRITDVVIHEICHSGFGLADEYEYPGNTLAYDTAIPNIEPANVPIPPATIKWDHVLYPDCVDANNKERKIIPGPISRWYLANREPLVKKPASDGSKPPSIVEPPLYGLAIADKTKPLWASLKKKVDFLDILFPEMLVGLYQGGAYSSTDYYRPAGTCKMRVCTKSSAGSPNLESDADYDLCYACKYAVVEKTATDLKVGNVVRKAMLKDLADNLDPARNWRIRDKHSEDDDVT